MPPGWPKTSTATIALVLRRDRGGDLVDVHVERLDVDVDEDRLGADEERGVGAGDEGEGRGDDLIARLHAGREHRAVQPGGAGGDADGVPAAGQLGDRALRTPRAAGRCVSVRPCRTSTTASISSWVMSGWESGMGRHAWHSTV